MDNGLKTTLAKLIDGIHGAQPSFFVFFRNSKVQVHINVNGSLSMSVRDFLTCLNDDEKDADRIRFPGHDLAIMDIQALHGLLVATVDDDGGTPRDLDAELLQDRQRAIAKFFWNDFSKVLQRSLVEYLEDDFTQELERHAATILRKKRKLDEMLKSDDATPFDDPVYPDVKRFKGGDDE